jgi:cell division protein FtsW
MSLQPTEFIKFSLILYLSSWLIAKEKKMFLSYFGLLGFIVFLTMLQPDLGTSIVIFGIFTILYFISGKDLKPFALLIPVSAVGFFFLIWTSAYRMKRFLAFLNPDLDPLGITYHVKQILISLSSGGLVGRGFSESRQKYQFLPEAHTDSIFAIIGEEIGFIGCFIIICLFFYLLFKTYVIAKNSHDKFAQLLASAIFALFALHIVINLGGMVNIMPLTGVPLPFLSSGGSSLIVFFSMIVILINIRKQNAK